MLTLKLYKMECERNRVNKSNYITLIDTLTGKFRDNCDILNPVILLEVPIGIDMSLPINFNYVHIPKLNRWYFLENVEILNSKLYVLYLKVDVLYSYSNEINNQKAFVERNENTYDMELKDEREIVYPTYDIDVVEFNNTFFLNPTQIPDGGIENIHTYITTIVGIKPIPNPS